jgi:EAL domain-containing protein (putative c-di-GMP-specific phosphodiesterase class I)
MALATKLPWIAVNVSPVQLLDLQFADRSLRTIEEMKVDPKRIQIEVTESVLIDKPEIALATLRKLRSHGISIAIDDFGTGYSSMSYLQQFPVDRLKIDRTFVHALSEGEEGSAIVSAMIEMARALRLDVVAEGVETKHQLNVLRSLGCHEMQGYFFARPMPAAELQKDLQEKSAA